MLWTQGLNWCTHSPGGKNGSHLTQTYSPGSPKYNTIWQKMVKAADQYNEPGRFTAFIGYEWTSLTDGRNMHRNVIFRDGGDMGETSCAFYDAGAIWKSRSAQAV